FAALAQGTPTQSADAPKKAPRETPSPSAKATSKSEPYPVIGYLEKRERVITIKSGPQGPVYSVATKEGKVLFENLSTEQLRAQAPEIHSLIKSSIADNRSAHLKANHAILDVTR